MTTALLAPKQIDALIKSVGATKAKLFDLIDTASVQCMLHARKHGDLTKTERLINECIGTKYEASLKRWVSTFMPVDAKTTEHGVALTMKQGWAQSDKWDKAVEKDNVIAPSVLEDRRLAKQTETNGGATDDELLAFNDYLKMAQRLVKSIDDKGARIIKKDGPKLVEFRRQLANVIEGFEKRYATASNVATTPATITERARTVAPRQRKAA